MKKNYLKSLLALGLSVSVLTACGGNGGNTETKTSSASKQASTASTTSTASKTSTAANGDAIRLVNGKIEIDEQLKKAAQLFKEKTGQEVVIESMGGGVDIQGQLKSYFAADNMPDMFVIG